MNVPKIPTYLDSSADIILSHVAVIELCHVIDLTSTFDGHPASLFGLPMRFGLWTA